ncbi:hypothetical protein BH23ACT6_BH23ACT6_21100 [soil metagenome]
MSDQPDRENIGDELTTYSADAEDQLQPEDTLMPGGDPVEEGYETAERLHGSVAFGTTAQEQAEEETIEQRIRQEVPEEGTAYGAPDNESGMDPQPMAGGDDPDAIPAEQDFVGEIGADATESGDLAPDRGLGDGDDIAMVASQPAEEAALHTVHSEVADTNGTQD